MKEIIKTAIAYLLMLICLLSTMRFLIIVTAPSVPWTMIGHLELTFLIATSLNSALAVYYLTKEY